MKTIKSVIILVFTLLLCCPAFAQQNPQNHWWGQDTVVVNKEEENTQSVWIGSDEDSQDKSYQWTGPNIQTSPNKPKIKVNPREPETEYVVRRVSKCGIEEAHVLVILTDEIEIVSVKRRCFMLGEHVSASDFEIVTRPEGHESEVEVLPDEANVPNEQPFLFSLEHNGHRSTKAAYMDVYTLEDTDTIPKPVKSVGFDQIANVVEKLSNLLRNADKVEDVVKTVAPPGVSPCTPDFGGSLDVVLSLPKFFGEACCNGEKVNEAMKLYMPGVNVYFGLDCAFPVPSFSFPPIGGIYVTVGFKAGITVGPAALIFRSLECIDGTVPIKLDASIYGGAKVEVAKPSFISAELKLEARGTSTIYWNIGKNLDTSGGIELSFFVVGTAQVMSLGEVTVEKQLGDSFRVLNE